MKITVSSKDKNIKKILEILDREKIEFHIKITRILIYPKESHSLAVSKILNLAQGYEFTP